MGRRAPEVWLVPGREPGTVAGFYRLELPDLENLDQAYLHLIVHPDERRHGIGRALLRHGAGRTAAHRGHRLGLLVKVAMLEWLATAEPHIERITTWNAEDNKHMIAVNDALGYTVFGAPATSWRLDVPDLAG